jgi:plasmid stabilization system protein ParE
MTWPLEYHPAVRSEVEAVELWHEMQRLGLGDEFSEDLRAVVTRIEEHPEHFAIVRRDVRQAMLKKFSYVVRFRWLKNRVRIVAVRHTSQASGGWQSRR